VKSIIAKFICATVVALSAIAVDQHASAEQVIIEAQAHHLGDDPGNEGTVFEKTFVLNSVPPDAFLQLDITGPNLESPPQILINGTAVGSIQPFFPPYNPNDPRWILNPDGSHDFTGLIQAWFPVTSLLHVGSNIFRIQNGRPDDDYFFSNVILTYCQAHPVPPQSKEVVGARPIPIGRASRTTTWTPLAPKEIRSKDGVAD